ncbi:MAG: SirB2 family protein [Candidatus Sedimenticola sp. (ex Thyasira tokunagai)]
MSAVSLPRFFTIFRGKRGPMLYYWIKNAHVATVMFNIAFFTLRYYWMLRRNGLVNRKIVRQISQFNDTLLLIAGIALALQIHQYPFQAQWLTVKLVGLLLYIIFGTLALKRGKSRKTRKIYGILALLTVGYMVTVALSRTPKSWILLGNF